MTPAPTRPDYAAMLERADAGVGQILQKLTALGLEQNTLVIFTNDNGGEWLSRNAPLFNRKATLWEGGIRVASIFRGPPGCPPARSAIRSGIFMDLTASILAATNTPVPPDASLEGINLLPILEGRSPQVERTLFWRTPNQKAVRKGDWKLLANGPLLFLFNLRDDIGEHTDLAAARIDVIREMRPLIAAWEADVDAERKAASR